MARTPPVGNEEASGSPWISSLPEKPAIALPSPVGLEEGVVLLRGRAGQRLEDVGVVGRAVLQRPLHHRLGDRVGQAGVERLAARQRRLELLEDVLGQALALHGGGEDVGAEDVVLGQGQVESAEGLSVGAPLRGGHVLLADTSHALVSSSLLARSPDVPGTIGYSAVPI